MSTNKIGKSNLQAKNTVCKLYYLKKWGVKGTLFTVPLELNYLCHYLPLVLCLIIVFLYFGKSSVIFSEKIY